LTACAADDTVTSTAVAPTPVLATPSPRPTAIAQTSTVLAQVTSVTPTPLLTLTEISPTFTPLPTAIVPVPTASPSLEPSPTPTFPPDLPQSGWQLGTSMPAPARSEMSAVTLNGLVYVPGGFGGANRLERYDPTTGQWQALAEMPAGRHHLIATTY
jgi:hypothetical protein